MNCLALPTTISRTVSRFRVHVFSIVLAVAAVPGVCKADGSDKAWSRHVIDNSSRGADGVRLADVNRDGYLDVATPWEEGGVVRIYLNPGPDHAKEKWPAVTVGKVGSPEDAVFVDINRDGLPDVVSCCEGNVKSAWVHWAPASKQLYMHSAAWKTEAIPATAAKKRWMFCLPMNVDGKNGVDLVLGAKGKGAEIGWLESPDDPTSLSAWKWHPIRKCGWVMSLVAADMDADGDMDIVASDRKGKKRGCFWLENPARGGYAANNWIEHSIGGQDKEVMFLDVADLDGDGIRDVLAAVRSRQLLYFRRESKKSDEWQMHEIKLPTVCGTAKSVRVGDIDLDGRPDIVFTCENASAKVGVMWLRYASRPTDAVWKAYDISGLQGVKYDLLELVDLDSDGDLDVITCEEAANLGVIWYENPTVP